MVKELPPSNVENTTFSSAMKYARVPVTAIENTKNRGGIGAINSYRV